MHASSSSSSSGCAAASPLPISRSPQENLQAMFDFLVEMQTPGLTQSKKMEYVDRVAEMRGHEELEAQGRDPRIVGLAAEVIPRIYAQAARLESSLPSSSSAASGSSFRKEGISYRDALQAPAPMNREVRRAHPFLDENLECRAGVGKIRPLDPFLKVHNFLQNASYITPEQVDLLIAYQQFIAPERECTSIVIPRESFISSESLLPRLRELTEFFSVIQPLLEHPKFVERIQNDPIIESRTIVRQIEKRTEELKSFLRFAKSSMRMAQRAASVDALQQIEEAAKTFRLSFGLPQHVPMVED
jgi:hypothetical protein